MCPGSCESLQVLSTQLAASCPSRLPRAPSPRATPPHLSTPPPFLAGPYEGERAWIRRARSYDGPAEDHITRVLDDCREVGLAVVLCLHGAPGGQSGHHACGFEDDDWTPEMWDVAESVRCIEHMAATWGQHPAMFGITVLNEASGRARTRACEKRAPGLRPTLVSPPAADSPPFVPCPCRSLLTRSPSPFWPTTTSNRTRPSASTRLRRT